MEDVGHYLTVVQCWFPFQVMQSDLNISRQVILRPRALHRGRLKYNLQLDTAHPGPNAKSIGSQHLLNLPFPIPVLRPVYAMDVCMYACV